MDPTHREVGIAEYAEGSLNDIRGRVTPPDIPLGVEAPLSSKVVTVLVRLAVMCTVELMERLRAGQVKIDAGDELAVLVSDLDLGLDVDAEHDVHDSKQRLPGRLGPAVDPGQRCQQGSLATTAGRTHRLQLLDRDVISVQG